MRFYPTPHNVYCGSALHARTMAVWGLNQAGERLVHRTMHASPETCLKAIAPSRNALAMAVAGLCPWYGLADLCAPAGSPCGLGQALALPASPGGQATNATSDAPTMAVGRRGGRRPPADVSPAARRATRALRRRQRALPRQRAARLAHLQTTKRPYPLPEMGTTLADTAPRDGGAARCPEPAVPPRRAGARALRGDEAPRLSALEWPRVTAAQPHDAPPGLGSRRGLAAGTSCASSGGRRATPSRVSPACRLAAPRAASSRGPTPRRAHATAPPGSAGDGVSPVGRLGSGGARAPGPSRPATRPCPDWSTHTARAPPGPAWPRREGGLSLTCAPANRPALCTRCARRRARSGGAAAARDGPGVSWRRVLCPAGRAASVHAEEPSGQHP